MIKILKEGNLPKPKRYIYNTKCCICNCEFEFEIDDCLSAEKRPNGLLTVECPCCQNHLTYSREILNCREVTDES